jgi:catechol 2,3-dioxygenase
VSARITGVRSLEVNVTSSPKASRFYRDVWQLQPVLAEGAASMGVSYYRGTSEAFPIFATHADGGPPAIRRVVLEAENRAAVDAVFERLRGRALPTERPAELPPPFGGYGFGFKDPEQRNFVVVHDDRARAAAEAKPDTPHKISHINLNSADYDLTTAFFAEVLGLRLIDESGRARFFHAFCADHFSIALVRAENATLNHVAFELPDLDSVMRGAGRMKDNGYPVEWGVGRHGPGNNVFAYFAGPDEIPLEYTSEMLQIDDSYVPRGPDYWKFPPGRTDQWGITAPPSARLHRIQQLFSFTEHGYLTRGAAA